MIEVQFIIEENAFKYRPQTNSEKTNVRKYHSDIKNLQVCTDPKTHLHFLPFTNQQHDHMSLFFYKKTFFFKIVNNLCLTKTFVRNVYEEKK